MKSIYTTRDGFNGGIDSTGEFFGHFSNLLAAVSSMFNSEAHQADVDGTVEAVQLDPLIPVLFTVAATLPHQFRTNFVAKFYDLVCSSPHKFVRLAARLA